MDKTGTLTESKLEMNCYKLSSLGRNNELNIGNEELTSKIMNKIYKKFWQNIYKKKLISEIKNENLDTSYQTSFLYNIIYFTECLATCHNIFCFNQKIFGNSIDKELFQELGWELFQENDDLKNPVFIQPHNAYKITENSIIDYDYLNINNNNINNINNENNIINIDNNKDNNNIDIEGNNNKDNNNDNNNDSPGKKLSFTQLFKKSMKNHFAKKNEENKNKK